MDPGQAEERQREIQELRGLLQGVVGLLIEKRAVRDRLTSTSELGRRGQRRQRIGGLLSYYHREAA